MRRPFRHPSGIAAEPKVLNLYSSRHYQTDEALYANFTQRTGIKVNRIEANEDALLDGFATKAAAVRGTCW